MLFLVREMTYRQPYWYSRKRCVIFIKVIKNPLLSTIHFRKMCYTILECMFDKVRAYELGEICIIEKLFTD